LRFLKPGTFFFGCLQRWIILLRQLPFGALFALPVCFCSGWCPLHDTWPTIEHKDPTRSGNVSDPCLKALRRI
jgi:hypothetical protein